MYYQLINMENITEFLNLLLYGHEVEGLIRFEPIITAAIIGGAAESLSALEEVSQRGQDLIDRVESGFVPGGLVSTTLNVVIVFFQLAMTWGKKD